MEGDAAGRWDSPITKGDAGTRVDEANPSDRKTSEKWNTRYKLSKDFRAPYDVSWDRKRRFLWGDQWANKLRPAWKARPVINYTLVAVQSIVPMMTDQNPTINVTGKRPDTQDVADDMQDVVRKVLRDEQLLVKSVYALIDSHAYGTGHYKVSCLPDEDGNYNVKLAHVDTRYFYLSPGAQEIQASKYVIYAYNDWIPNIKDRYGYKGKIPSGTWDEALTHKPVDTQKTLDADGTFTFSQQSVMVSQVTAPTLDQTQMATVCEGWDRDPDGSVWCTILANGVVVKDRFRPYKHKYFPFVRLLNYPVPSQYWGVGEVDMLESPQDSVNRAEAMIADITRMCTNPQMLISKDSGISMKDISNRVGGFIVHNPDRPPQWMQPPQVQGALFEIVQNNKLHMDNMSGVHDAARGQLPGGEKISGVAIQSLQAATSSRVGLKTRLFEAALVEVAIQVIELIKEFYLDRTMNVGKRYVSLNKWKEGTAEIDRDIYDVEFDVDIGVGSTLPVDKGVRFQQSLQIYQVTQGQCMSKQQLLRDAGKNEEDVNRILSEVEDEQKETVQEQAQLQSIAQQAQAGAGIAPAPAGQGGQAGPPGVASGPQPQGSGANAQGGAPVVPSEEEISALEQRVHARTNGRAA